jgi:cobyrinic acid a,c-diamide synthase
MGLFDGSVKREGSSADVAALLQLPVILILNAKAMAYSAAALLYGLRNFDPALRIAGVIFNFVNTDTHYRLLREAAEDAGVTALGHLPVNNELHIPSRHLGLDTADAGAAIAAAARHIEAHLDLDAILAATRSARTSTSPIQPGNPRTNAIPSLPPSEAVGSPRGDKTIFVARDAAFHFLYRENLRMLERYGSIRFFSPLSDPHLPGKGNLLYLPGGYPELYLEQLSANTSLLRDIRAFAGNGGRILAECGGMMFLGHSITDEAGKAWPAVGLLDLGTTIKEKRLSLGYRTLTLDGQGLKGHEFHYSQFTAPPADPNPNITVCNARGQEVPAPVFYQRNLFASYMHFYWGESTGPLESWLAS